MNMPTSPTVSSTSTAAEPTNLTAGSSTGRKCKECDYFGPEESFPLPLKNTGYGPNRRLVNCWGCTQRMRQREEKKRAKAERKKLGIPEPETIPTMTLDELLKLLEEKRGHKLALDVYVNLPYDLDLPDLEPRAKKPGTEEVFRLANAVRNLIHTATAFRWSQKKRMPTNGDKAAVVTYHCSQLEEERPKHKERTRVSGQLYPQPCMERYHCNGWLNIYVTHGDNTRVRVRMTHDLIHPYPSHWARVKKAVKGHNQEAVQPPSVAGSDAGTITEVCDREKFPSADDTSLWLPPVVASSCLPPSINKGRASSIHDAIPSINENFQRIISAASQGVDSYTAARIDVLFMEITRLGESLRSSQPP